MFNRSYVINILKSFIGNKYCSSEILMESSKAFLDYIK